MNPMPSVEISQFMPLEDPKIDEIIKKEEKVIGKEIKTGVKRHLLPTVESCSETPLKK